MLLIAGTLLIVLGVLSRLFSLGLLRRVTASPTRDATPSWLPGTPWFHVRSDRAVLKVIVVVTYAAVLLGMLLFIIGLLTGNVGAQ